MGTNKLRYSHLLPVLMSFLVMSFVDLVGIGVDRVSKDMALSATMGQLIPSAAFLWFLLLSVPTGIIQARIGKRLMLNIGMGITALGMLLPFFIYSFGTVLTGFALLGIGNTIVQVSANPLLVDVVPGNRVSSFMSFSQFIKAIGSMIGAPLAALFAIQFGDWKLIFLVFGIVSILSVLWLGSVKIYERGHEVMESWGHEGEGDDGSDGKSGSENATKVTFGTAFKLLGNSFIFLMVLSIFVVVGIDVGFNSNSGQFLIRHFGMEDVAAESGRSVYFFGKMLGTFIGAIILSGIALKKFFLWIGLTLILWIGLFIYFGFNEIYTYFFGYVFVVFLVLICILLKVSARKLFVGTSIFAILALIAIISFDSHTLAWILVFIIGLTVANIWPLVFSITIERFPDRANEVSGLMMMAICGGAVIPLLMGWITDMIGPVAGMAVLIVCIVYLLGVAVYSLKK